MPEESIYDRYVKLHDELAQNPDYDEATKNLPVLFAAEYLATQLRAEADRIIAALGSPTERQK